MVYSELYCYLLDGCTIPSTPFFHKSHLHLLENWLDKNIIIPYYIELNDKTIADLLHQQHDNINTAIKKIKDINWVVAQEYKQKHKIVNIIFQ